MTPDRMLRWLLSFPFPGALAAMQGGDLVITLEGEVLRFDGAWRAPDGQRIPCTLDDAPSADDIHAEIRRGLAIACGITGASWHEVEQHDTDPNGNLVYRLLSAHPYPVASDLRLSLDGICRFYLDGVTWCFRADGWHVGVEPFAHHLPAAEHVTADLLHAEIGRVRALVGGETQADCVGPELPADDPPYDLAAAEQALGKVTAERDALLVAESTLSKIAAALAIPALEPHDDALSMVRRLVDGYTVVSQRLVGSQKEVAERDATIEELRGALETIAAHVGADGSDQWAVEVIKAKVGDLADRAEKVEDRLRRDDELREQIAAAVGLDGSASLALILDTVRRDRPGREISRLSGLLDVFAAPVAFGERRLSTVERVEWALRRALRERDECAPRMVQLIDAEVLLDTLGVPAYAAVPGDDPGDASEALTVAERLRLHFGAQS